MTPESNLQIAKEALEKIFNLGHNDDCLFCGFKDRLVKETLASINSMPPQEEESYWKQRCEAIETVLEMSQSKGYGKLEFFGVGTEEWERHFNNWQKLKRLFKEHLTQSK